LSYSIQRALFLSVYEWPSKGGCWTATQDQELIALIDEGLSWSEIGKRRHTNPITCHTHFVRLQQKVAVDTWSEQTETTFKKAYEKSKADFWVGQ